MTYREAIKKKPGDMIQPKCLSCNVRIKKIKHMPKTILFECKNGITYDHREVNQPILVEIQNGHITYAYNPVTNAETHS